MNCNDLFSHFFFWHVQSKLTNIATDRGLIYQMITCYCNLYFGYVEAWSHVRATYQKGAYIKLEVKYGYKKQGQGNNIFEPQYFDAWYLLFVITIKAYSNYIKEINSTPFQHLWNNAPIYTALLNYLWAFTYNSVSNNGINKFSFVVTCRIDLVLYNFIWYYENELVM